MKVDHIKQSSNLSIFFQKGLFQHNDQFRFTKVYRLIFFFKCDCQYMLLVSNLKHWHMGMLTVFTTNILPKNCKLYGQTYNRN